MIMLKVQGEGEAQSMLRKNSQRVVVMNRAILFIILLLLSCIMIYPSFGDLDDGFILRNLNDPDVDIFDLQKSRIHFILYYVSIVAPSVFGINPYVFYGFKLLTAGLSCFMLFSICNKLKIAKTYSLLIVLLVFVNPAFIYSYFKLCNQEYIAYVLLLLITFLLLMLFDDDVRGERKSLIYPLIFMLSILTVFTKECNFILLFMFSISYLVITKFASGSNSTEVFPGGRFVFFSFIGSSALFLLVYYLTMIRPEDSYMGTNYIAHNLSKGLVSNQSIVSHWAMRVFISAFNHFTYNPIFVAGAVLVLTRLYHRQPYMDRAKQIGVYRYIYLADSFIVASFSFMSFYIVFGLSSPRYLLPAYAFLVPALCIYGRVLFDRGTREVSLWRAILPAPIRKTVVMVLLLLLCNSILTGVNVLIRTKYIPFNMSEMVDNSLPTVRKELDTKRDKEDITFFTVGENPGIEQFFLLKDQIDISRFKFKDLSCILKPQYHLPELRGKPDGWVEQPNHGDFILITPYSYKTNIHEATRNIEGKFDVALLHKSPSNYYFQLPTLRTLVKYVFNKPSDGVDFYLYQVM